MSSITNKMKDKLKDKRLSKRYRVEMAIDISVRSIAGSRPFTFRTGNISKGGVYVQSEGSTPFSMQSMVEVALYLDGEASRSEERKISFLGKVAHMRDKVGFGIKVIQIEPSEQDKLDKFVDDYLVANPDVLED